MVLVPVVPPEENWAGHNSGRVSGMGSAVRVVMCFQGPRDGAGLLDATVVRGGVDARAPLACPLTKCRYANVTNVPAASAIRMGSSHTRARLGVLRGLRPRAAARDTLVPASLRATLRTAVGSASTSYGPLGSSSASYGPVASASAWYGPVASASAWYRPVVPVSAWYLPVVPAAAGSWPVASSSPGHLAFAGGSAAPARRLALPRRGDCLPGSGTGGAAASAGPFAQAVAGSSVCASGGVA